MSLKYEPAAGVRGRAGPDPARGAWLLLAFSPRPRNTSLQMLRIKAETKGWLLQRCDRLRNTNSCEAWAGPAPARRAWLLLGTGFFQELESKWRLLSS